MRLYGDYIRRKRLTLLLSVLLMLITAIYAVGVGSIRLSFPELIMTLIGKGESLSQTAIINIRLPRVAAAILVGAALASAGAVMQCVLRNPLASASTLGVSQGAAFGAAVGIVVFGGGVVNSATATSAITINNPYIVTVCAFVCGSISSVVIIAISQIKKDIGPGGLVLAGVALSSLFSGGSTLLQYFTDDTKLGAIVFWTFGNLGSANWRDLGILAAVLAAAMMYFMFNRWNYNKKYPKISQSWRDNWPNLSTYFKYPQEVRRLIYTTNTIEGFNRQLRKVTKAKSVFPTDDSLLKMLYLAMMDITKKWTGRRQDWSVIHAQLTVFFADRMPE